jgi:ubiquitin carboxyl-terminal hydrolase 14
MHLTPIHTSQKNFSAGLENLGNTCYMNSTLQCLYSVPELRAALAAYSASPVAQHTQFDGPHRLTAATRDLFAELGRSGTSVTPMRFLTTLRQVFPQFASQARNGAYMQQDAEECWTGIMETLRQLTTAAHRPADGNGSGDAGAAVGGGVQPVVKELFGMDLATVLKSPETGEERAEQRTEFSFKCNITSAVNHVMDGFRLALDMTREAASEAAGRTVVFTGRSCLTRLPAYLTVQLVRFDYRQDTRQRCKIQKEVAFSVSLDVYEFAGEALKASLDGARRRKQEADDKKLEQKNTGQTAVADAAGAEGSGGDVAMGEPAVPPSPTGFYDLRALITHKGRDADSGHYVAYVKQGDGSWREFDDEKPIPRSEDDILRLRGGLGDHPCAYLMLYKSVLA